MKIFSIVAFVFLMLLLSFLFGHVAGWKEGFDVGYNAGNCMHVKEWKEYINDDEKHTYTITIHKCGDI
jgi:hypothetical protein